MAPSPSVPSPMKTTLTPALPSSCLASAMPAALGTMPPWTPLDMKPGAHRCWLPPMPPHTPSGLPMISAISPSASPVRARKCPWQRWLENTWSSSPRCSMIATASASWPMHACVVPLSRPRSNSSSRLSSKRRMNRIRRYNRSARGSPGAPTRRTSPPATSGGSGDVSATYPRPAAACAGSAAVIVISHIFYRSFGPLA